MKLKQITALLLASLLLASCGGGADDTTVTDAGTDQHRHTDRVPPIRFVNRCSHQNHRRFGNLLFLMQRRGRL